MKNPFLEEDKEKLVKFLNMVATKAKFNDMSTQEIIEYFRLLNFMQATLLPKVNDHIFEIKEVIEEEEEIKDS